MDETFELTVRIWPQRHGAMGYTERTLRIRDSQAAHDILKDFADAVKQPQNNLAHLEMRFRGLTQIEAAQRMCQRLEAYLAE